MDQKIGRNDPCTCGSGKKYKQCCALKIKPPATKRKLTAKWINAPAVSSHVEVPNLMERTFGNAINAASSIYIPPSHDVSKTDFSKKNEKDEK